MERKTAEDFDQDLLILFDAYVHGDIDRRGFLDRAAKFAVGGMTAAHAARRPHIRSSPRPRSCRRTTSG